MKLVLKSVFTGEYAIFLQRLISARKEAGLTQQDMAGRLHKLQSFVSKYERGERRLDVVEFMSICRALEVDPCAIIREIEALSIATPHFEQESSQ